MRKIFQSGLMAALLIGSAATAANAQVLYGPVAGAAASTARLNFKNGNPEPGTSMVFGPTAGFMLHIPFGNLAVQPALMYSRKGMELKYTAAATDTTVGLTANVSSQLGYITLPVNIVYTTGGDHGFQIFAGGYAALGVGGKRKVTIKGTEVIEGFSADTTYTDDVYFSDQAHNPQDENLRNEYIARGGFAEQTGYFREVDFGVQGGLGYLMNGFQIQASANAGLRNIFTADINGTKPVNEAKNLSFQLTVGYLFGR